MRSMVEGVGRNYYGSETRIAHSTVLRTVPLPVPGRICN